MDDKKTALAEDREIVKGLDFTVLKEAIRELNPVIDQYNSAVEDDKKIKKARLVGAKKIAMFQLWRDAMDGFIDVEFSDTPEFSVNLYMSVYPPEDAGGPQEVEEEVVEEVEEVEEEEEVVEEVEEEESEKAEKKPTQRGASVTTFTELEQQLKNPKSVTAHFDRICLKGGTIEQLLAKFLKYLSDNDLDFKSLCTKTKIKQHIEFRQNNGYVYEEQKGKIKLVGFEPI